jgi:flagellar hook-associated protein 2
VSALVSAERVPIQRIQANIAKQQQRLSSWTAVQTSASNLRTKIEQLCHADSWGRMRATVTQADSVVSAAASDSAADGSYEIQVSGLAKAYGVYGDEKADATTALGLTGDFQIQGSAPENCITVVAEDSLNSIAAKINAASASWTDPSLAVRATVIGGRLVTERTQKGTAGVISLTDGGAPAGVLQAGNLGLLNGTDLNHAAIAGSDLVMTVNGVAVTRTGNTDLTDVIAGVTLSFTKTGSAQLAVGRDTATIRSQIQGFVDAYNALMSKIETESAVSISAGGSVNSTGTLQGDSLARDIAARGRALVTATAATDPDIAADYDSLRKIGIWTSGSSNRLTIESSKLDAVLRDHADEVEDLFRDPEAGILTKLSEYLDTVVDPVDSSIQRRKDGLQASIRAGNGEITTIERRLVDYETMLYEQYTRLQQTLDSMNKQLASLSGLLDQR